MAEVYRRPRALALSRIVELIAPRLDPVLAPPDALRWLIEHGTNFGVTTNLILEVAPLARTVDLAMPVFGDDRSLHELATDKAIDGAAMAGPLTLHSSFDAARDLAAAALAHDPDTVLWLEWDAPRAGMSQPPGVSVYIDVPPACSVEQALTRARLLDALDDTPADAGSLQRLANALEKLPPGCTPKYLGRMLARGATGIRIAAQDFRAEQVLAYLQSLGWPHDTADLDRWLRSLSATWNPIDLQVDLDDPLSPRVGLNIEHPGPFGTTPFWPDLFERLSQGGLPCDGLHSALSAWEGHIVDGSAHEELFLRVSHVKLALEQHRCDLRIYLAILRY
jgi:hypothetical protein